MTNIILQSKLMLIKALLAVLIIMLPYQAFAWTKVVNFEDGTDGSIANGVSGFDYAGTRTTISTEMAAFGSKSAKMVWIKGDTGWGTAHGEINFPSRLVEGDEVWVRGYYYFEPSWSFLSNIGEYSGVKILRVATDSGGWDSIASVGRPNLTLSNEPGLVQLPSNAPFILGSWQCLEIYLKLSSTNGKFRIWQNGNLIFEDLVTKTLKSSTNYSNFASTMSVWNNGVGQDQIEYVDEFVITTDTPSQTDSNGNPMIGLLGGVSATRPLPPTGLTITVAKNP